jgi:hypothetical protein
MLGTVGAVGSLAAGSLVAGDPVNTATVGSSLVVVMTVVETLAGSAAAVEKGPYLPSGLVLVWPDPLVVAAK